MKKILLVLLVLFVLFDIGLAVVFFNPNLRNTALLGFLSKNCKVVDRGYCKSVTIVGNEKKNETVAALFNLPKGTKVYSPIDGRLSYQLIPGTENLPYHLIKGVDGATYFLVFEPALSPQSKSVKAGDVLGVTTGKKFSLLKNNSLAVSVSKNQGFGKAEFDTLFR